MSLSPEATKVFDHLPADGTKVGGITLQRELKLTKLEYQRAREELKAEGLVVPGQGRGGSLGRVEGVEPKEEKVVSKVERLAHAREVKQAKNQQKKETQSLIWLVVQYAMKTFPQVKAKDVSFSGPEMMPIIAVWKGSTAQMYTIPQLEYDKLRAEQR